MSEQHPGLAKLPVRLRPYTNTIHVSKSDYSKFPPLPRIFLPVLLLLIRHAIVYISCRCLRPAFHELLAHALAPLPYGVPPTRLLEAYIYSVVTLTRGWLISFVAAWLGELLGMHKTHYPIDTRYFKYTRTYSYSVLEVNGLHAAYSSSTSASHASFALLKLEPGSTQAALPWQYTVQHLCQ